MHGEEEEEKEEEEEEEEKEEEEEREEEAKEVDVKMEQCHNLAINKQSFALLSFLIKLLMQGRTTRRLVLQRSASTFAWPRMRMRMSRTCVIRWRLKCYDIQSWSLR